MSPLIIAAIISAIPAMLEFIEFLIKNRQRPSVAERLHLRIEQHQLRRARHWANDEQRTKIDEAIAKIEAALQ